MKMRDDNEIFGIIEFIDENHSDLILSVNEYLYNGSHGIIYIFTTDSIFKRLKEISRKTSNHIVAENIVIIDINKPLKSFNQIKKLNINTLYINSAYFNFFDIKKNMLLLLLFLLDAKIYLSVHNINDTVDPKSNTPLDSLVNIMKKISVKKAHGFVVLNVAKKNYLEKLINKEIIVIPFKIPIKEEFLKNCKRNQMKKTIVIPGGIEERRRNYSQLLFLLGRVLEKRNDLKFIFLGKNSSAKDRFDIVNFKQKNNENIKLFDDYIDQEEYDSYMINADFILAPLQRKIKMGATIEYYGETKASGAEFDAYKYQNKLIIPSFYRINNEEIDVTYYNDYNELYDIFLKI
ncbi:MAG: hypothetical protein QCI00_04515 [Candidatus Thermoplasmatota archaeon]|nr:hypothetical protein [Candidatus Thermoplasmatota archaeon]